MKLRIKSTMMLAACAAGFLSFTEKASAVATLAIDVGNDGSFEFVIPDGSIDDIAATLGTVGFLAPSGTGVFSITTGITKPATGSVTRPRLSLSEIAGNGPAGVYAIYFSETGFGPSAAGYYADIAFNPFDAEGATIDYKSYSSASNALFATTDLLTSQFIATATVGSAITGSTAPAYVTGGAPFSLTQKLVITLTGTGSFTAAANLSSVPDGGTSVALLGMSLLGLHGLRRKFSK